MKEIGVFEAKTHLPKLLEQVVNGEQYTITKHGVPIAMLVPISTSRTRNLDMVIDKLKHLHTDLGIKGLTAKQARESGRKY